MAIGFSARELRRRRAAAQQRLVPRLIHQVLRLQRRADNAIRLLFEEMRDRQEAEEALADLRRRLLLLAQGEPEQEP